MAEGRGLSLITDEADEYARRTKELSAKDPKGEKEEKSEKERKQDLVEKAVKCLQLATSAEYEQRQREEEDLKFDRALPNDQWPEGVRTARAGGVGEAGGVVNERPCLVINKLDQPVQQVINEARGARISVKIKPKSDGASQEGAEIRQAIYRTIESDSRAHIARLWALDRAVKCGRGAYRVTTKYANDGDFDQDIVIERILNQGSVYLDPYATEPDWSDMEWAIITSDLPIEEYKRRFPKSKLTSCSAEELESIGNKVPGWIGTTEEEGSKTIRVAEYFYIRHEKRELLFSSQFGGKVWKDELAPGAPMPPDVTSRDIDVRHVQWCVINAEEVLEEADWNGRYIPIVPVIGKEYNVSGDRSWKGVISNSKDAQRSYNYMRSAQVEAVGLAPKAPWIMAEGQDEGYEAMWDQSNTKNYTRLKYKPVDFMGKPVAPPQRNVAEPAIQAISQAVNAAAEDIKSTTGRFDPSLGRVRADQSGKAIGMLKESGEATTSNYLENLTSISMHYEAKVVLDLMQYVYDRPGRVLRVMGEEEHQDQTVMLNQPFVMGPDKQPQAAPPPGMLERLGQTVGLAKKRDPRFLDLRNGQYSVEVAVGKSFPTQREENSEMLRSIIESAPGLTPMLADLLVEQLDTPIAKRAAERLRKLNPEIQKAEEQGEQQIPPEVQQQLQQMGQQMEQMTQVLQQQNEEIKSNRYKTDKDFEAKMQELAVRREIAIINAQTVTRSTQVKAQTDEEIAEMKLRAQIYDDDREREHEGLENEREREVKTINADRDREDRREDRVTKLTFDMLKAKKDREAREEERDFKREDRDATIQHDRDMRVADTVDERRAQDHERATRADELSHERATRAADVDHENRSEAEQRRHESQEEERRTTRETAHETTMEMRRQMHERKMADEQSKREAKNKPKPSEKK